MPRKHPFLYCEGYFAEASEASAFVACSSPLGVLGNVH